MEIMIIHSSYFHFQLISKSFFSILFIRSVCSSKMYSWKDTSPNYITIKDYSRKETSHKTRIGRFVWFQKSYKGKQFFEPCFQLLKINNLGQFESPNKSILVKKKVKRYKQSGILLFTMLKTLDSYLYMKPNLAKNQIWIRSWRSVIEYMKYQHTTWEGCVSRSRSTVWTSHPTFRIDSSLQKRMKQWNKLPMSTILWTNSKNCPEFWKTLSLLIIVSLSNALWFFVWWLIEILLVQNYL